MRSAGHHLANFFRGSSHIPHTDQTSSIQHCPRHTITLFAMDQLPRLPDTYDMSTLPHLAYVADLPIIDEQGMLDNCGEWSFCEELLSDTIHEHPQRYEQLADAIDQANGGSANTLNRAGEPFHEVGLNLCLPAMTHVGRQIRRLGGVIERCSSDEDRLVCWAAARLLLTATEVEWLRLAEEALPRVRQLAEQEALEIQQQEQEQQQHEEETHAEAEL